LKIKALNIFGLTFIFSYLSDCVPTAAAITNTFKMQSITLGEAMRLRQTKAAEAQN